MGFDFSKFGTGGLNEEFVGWLIDEQWPDIDFHFMKLWNYYQNPVSEVRSLSDVGSKSNESTRSYVQAQEYGLPARITGLLRNGSANIFGGQVAGDVRRKEVVVENDISWRINAMVDFLFGKQISFVSHCPSVSKRREIEQIINAVISANGGIGFLQDMAVLGSVYGFVDCVLRPGPTFLFDDTLEAFQSKHTFSSILKLASSIGLELIEAPRALPVLDENDYRVIQYYAQHFHQQKNNVTRSGNFLAKLTGGKLSGAERESCEVTEVMGPHWWQRYENRQLVSEGVNPLGRVPVVHIQNLVQPYYYEGVSDVEPLIPLQDELNTRLSDRANRVTFQSFKMYLAKGVEGMEGRPVAPGRMWFTDNPEASIDSFGGDSSTPSEDFHITEIREAMDKTSSVTPVVAGVLKSKLGNLTSAVALRMTLMGMLAKTERKRFTYGEGLKQIIGMVFDLLDRAGIYHTEAEDRDVEIIFPSPLPENMLEKLQEAKLKKELGVPGEQVLRELGYPAETVDAGEENLLNSDTNDEVN